MSRTLTSSHKKWAGTVRRVRGFIVHLIAYLVIWMIITAGDVESLLFGVPFSLLAAASAVFMSRPGSWRFSPLGLAKFTIYFLQNSIIGGVDVALRAIKPSMPLNPGFVSFEFRLPCDFSRALLADTVSLLPGTLSAGFTRDSVYLHVLDISQPVEAETRKIEKLIADAFYLKLSGASDHNLSTKEGIDDA